MKTIIIGGGASGLLGAYYSAINGDNVILIEKNEKLGKKIYITGKGRCNVTNDCEPEEFLKNVVTNPKFLYGAIYAYPPQKLIELLENAGLTLKTERGRRVFPMSDKSSDVIKTLELLCRQVGVEIKLNEKVEKIITQDNIVKKVITNRGENNCDKIIVCTGGKSYPSTGSTGDGYSFAKSVGHNVILPKSALCPIEIKGDFCKNLQGVSLKNVTLTVKRNGKVIYSELGEMIFTHFGISGPIVLSASSYINKYSINEIELSLDLKPALTDEQLDNRVLRDFLKYKNRDLQNSLGDLLPKSLIKCIIELSKISPYKKNDIITKEERKRLIDSLKRIRLDIKGLRPIEEAIITSGGVDCKQINPKTMESKFVKGLYFAGEVLDVDALTGGYNLQIAFATAYLAANAGREQ